MNGSTVTVNRSGCEPSARAARPAALDARRMMIHDEPRLRPWRQKPAPSYHTPPRRNSRPGRPRVRAAPPSWLAISRARTRTGDRSAPPALCMPSSPEAIMVPHRLSLRGSEGDSSKAAAVVPAGAPAGFVAASGAPSIPGPAGAPARPAARSFVRSRIPGRGRAGTPVRRRAGDYHAGRACV